MVLGTGHGQVHLVTGRRTGAPVVVEEDQQAVVLVDVHQISRLEARQAGDHLAIRLGEPGMLGSSQSSTLLN